MKLSLCAQRMRCFNQGSVRHTGTSRRLLRFVPAERSFRRKDRSSAFRGQKNHGVFLEFVKYPVLAHALSSVPVATSSAFFPRKLFETHNPMAVTGCQRVG